MLATEAQIAKLVNVFRSGTKLTYKKGEYILRPGEAPSAVYYIETGLVKAFNISKYGEENLLIVRREGDIFPLIWAITGDDRHIIYQTLGPTVLWRISREIYLDYLLSHTDALPPVLDMAIEMYRRHSERILNLEYRTVRERLISFLLTMSGRFGEDNKRGRTINVPLRQQDIASSINSSRETTSRELTYLERQGLIALASPHIIILDSKKLQSYL
jgi:CRP-like cAMP-binding protein